MAGTQDAIMNGDVENEGIADSSNNEEAETASTNDRCDDVQSTGKNGSTINIYLVNGKEVILPPNVKPKIIPIKILVATQVQRFATEITIINLETGTTVKDLEKNFEHEPGNRFQAVVKEIEKPDYEFFLHTLRLHAEAGDPPGVQRAIELMQKINREFCDRSLVGMAIIGNIDVLNLLLQNNADINYDFEGTTALAVASRKGFTEFVRICIENKAEVEKEGNRGIVPLHLAAVAGHTPIIKLLLQNKANVDKSNMSYVSALCEATKGSHISAVQALLEADANIHCKDLAGLEPLHVACCRGCLPIMDLLFERKAAHSDLCRSGITPLGYAAMNGMESIMSLLLHMHADLDHQDHRGDAILLRSAFLDSTILDFLLEHNANPNIRNKLGDSCITLSATFGNTRVLSKLLNAKADTEILGRDQLPPLLETTPRGHIECVELLLQARCDATVKDLRQDTALHLAAANGIIPVISSLIQAQAQINASNSNGNTPLSLAVLGDHPGKPTLLVTKLLEHRADITHRNNDGLTAYDLAVEKQRDDIIRLLEDYEKNGSVEAF